MTGARRRMAKNLLEMRIGVRRSDGFRSSLWKLWATPKSDTYLARRDMAGIQKYSFHAGGMCRSAFTSQHGTPPALSDRAMMKWKRHRTPPAGSGKVAMLARVAFPTNFLSRLADEDNKQVVWIPAAQPGKAAILEVMYTADSKADLIKAVAPVERHVIEYVPLPSGENLAAVSCCAEWDRPELFSPGGDSGSIFPDLLFSADDPDDTGRPVRLLWGPTPKDGDALELEELGGYRTTHQGMKYRPGGPGEAGNAGD